MKKNKQKLLDDFDKSMKRDKSNDIIVGNSFMKNEEFQNIIKEIQRLFIHVLM